ncbi:hypothetical protein LDL08_29900 [Nonomuraea glycinis]|uniref:Uncharacterized protein n=1 Tax=Nonomuraea glycinis TaxID=2047744 RepID=A0A918E4D4_9ACTN|nr:hypothetical protein [Nonomuraea glycinis]MCA2180402.1 hypothetical protein [Nonomuraea glycinis]GGP04144.1 hypothetical protein GCM10012278_18330 [Nonomuraea glycinis]
MEVPPRSSLVSLIDQFIQVETGPQVPRDFPRPILVLEGIGGSGRSHILDDTWRRWAKRTPIAKVDPLVGADDGDSMRAVLTAVMLGLTAEVPGYRVAFPRVVLAHIAMSAPITVADPKKSMLAMRERINAYQDRSLVVTLLRRLLAMAAGSLGLDAASLDVTLEQMTGRLDRSGLRSRLLWRDALAWFEHQDQGFRHDPERALVRLSLQADVRDAGVQEDVDRLLVAALLADLRSSFDRAVNHPSRAVVLLDNGDVPSAARFMKTLVKVRDLLARHQVPRDPLTVITTSGGYLLADSAGLSGRAMQWPESALAGLSDADLSEARTWLRVLLDGLTADAVQHLVATDLTPWPSALGTGTITRAVRLLTDGHAEATHLVLARLREDPTLIDELGLVLAERVPDPGQTMESYLIDKITMDLSPRRRLLAPLREALITLAGARDTDEARCLTSLLGNAVHAEPILFCSPSLWPTPLSTEPERWAMAPFVRFLLLRELSARPDNHQASWTKVFERLRDHTEDHDVRGRLHHELALGEHEVVVDELLRLLGEMPGTTWLEHLDRIVATPGLRTTDPSADPRSATAPAADPRSATGPESAHPDRAADPRRAAVAQLVTAVHRLADPLLSDRETRRGLYVIAAEECRRLSDADALPFLERAQHFQKLADSLA